MKFRKAIAIGVCTAMVLQSMGMVSMAEIREQVGRESVITSVASPSDAQKVEGNVSNEVYAPSQEKGDIANSRKLEATPSDAVYVNSEEDLKQAVKKSGTIIVSNDISLTDTLVITDGVSVELRGGTVSFAGDKGVRNMIAISGGANVKLQDFILDATELNDIKNNSVIWIRGGDKTSYLLIDGDTAIITTNKDTSKKNAGICGIMVEGKCQIESGTISGFSVGLVVSAGSELVINDIDLVGCHQGIGVVGKNKNNSIDGVLYLNGGTISGNGGGGYGILNRGQVYMAGGTITRHYGGVLNCNEDALSHETFAPIFEISGGEIYGNSGSAIVNQVRGTVIIKGDAEISGSISRERQVRSLSSSSKDSNKYVVKNENAILRMEDGTITAAASGEIAVSNDEESTFEMIGGTIVAIGDQSYAIQNKNKDVGAVAIKGGNISATGNGSQIFDNQGYMEVSKDAVVETNETDKFLVSVAFNEGGTVTPGTEMAATDQVIEFTITPYTGYKVESVMFDGVSQLAPYKLDVAGKSHFVEVTFVKVSSGDNSSGGGSGSGGSSSGRSAAKTAVSVIPETPGSWLQTEAGWQYLNANGNAYANTWIYKAGKWYWIESNGFMAEGWKQINNQWYYLMTTSGEMKTGWIMVDGKWYFLGTDGKMAANTTTPDGYQVDASGVWIQ